MVRTEAGSAAEAPAARPVATLMPTAAPTQPPAVPEKKTETALETRGTGFLQDAGAFLSDMGDFLLAALPYLLVLPQLLITAVFFLWPAGEALWYSLQSLDPFGLSSRFVGLENFRRLFADPYYLDSFWTTLTFSGMVTGFGMLFSLLLAALVAGVIVFL